MPNTDAARQAEVDKLKRKRAAAIDAYLVGFGSSLATVLALWPEQIDGLLDDLLHVGSAAVVLSYLNARLPQQLEALGFYSLAKEAIAKYPEAIDAAHQQIEAAGFKPEEIAAYDTSDLNILQSIDRDRIIRAGTSTVLGIAENVAQARALGLPDEEVQQGYRKEIDELHTATVRTVDTGTNLADRVVGWHLWGQLVKEFKYEGPDDIKTRRFCKAHLGMVHTMDEWMKTDNGFTPPWNHAWLSGGGINCRHWFTPVIKQAAA